MYDTLRKLAWSELQNCILMDSGTMLDKRTGEVSDTEVDSTYWKNKF